MHRVQKNRHVLDISQTVITTENVPRNDGTTFRLFGPFSGHDVNDVQQKLNDTSLFVCSMKSRGTLSPSQFQ